MAGVVNVGNGPEKVAYDFQSMEITIVANGESIGICKGVETVEYNCSIERVKVWGGSRDPMLRTEGTADYDGSITMYRFWWHFLVAKSKELGIPLGFLEMLIPVSYFTKDGAIVTDTMSGARIANINTAMSEGAENAMVEVPLDLMTVYYQGATVWGDTLGDGAPIGGGSSGPVQGGSRLGLPNGGFDPSTGSFGGGVSFP